MLWYAQVESAKVRGNNGTINNMYMFGFAEGPHRSTRQHDAANRTNHLLLRKTF